MMNGYKGRLLLASIVAGVFLLMGCGAATTEDGDGNQVTSGPNNLIVRINSPIDNGLYNRNDPEFGYVITEGSDNTDVAAGRLSAAIYHSDDSGNRAGDRFDPVVNLTNGAALPAVEDGGHQLELIIWKDEQNSEKMLTLIISYATDITPAVVNVSQIATTNQAPTLKYVIDDPCFGSVAGCEESVQLLDSVGTVILTLTGDSNGYLLPDLAEGEYTLIVRYTDLAGNTTTAKSVFIIDKTASEIQIAVAEITTNDKTPLLFYEINDPCVAAGNCKHENWLVITLDSAPVSTRNGEPLPTMGDGIHYVEITFTDDAGNKSTRMVKYIIDTAPPVVLIADDSGEGGVPNPDDTQITDGGDTLKITGSAGSGTVVFTTSKSGTANVFVNGGLIAGNIAVTANVSNTVNVNSLVPGNYTVLIEAQDELGNQSESFNFNFAVQDVASPVVGINSPLFASDARRILHPATATGGNYDVTFNFSVGDNATAPQDITVSVTLEEFQNSTGTWVMTGSHVVDISDAVTAFTDQEGIYEKIVALADGNYRLVVTAEDDASAINSAASNNVGTNATVMFKVDTTAPEVNITAPAGTVTSNEPVLMFESNEESREDGVAVSMCQDIDGACWNAGVPVDGKLRLAGGQSLPDGGYTVYVSLTDHAGFTGTADSHFTVKAAQPRILILNPLPNEVITGGKVKVKIQESGFTRANLYLSFDGGAETLVGEKPVGFPEPNVELFEFVPLPNNGKYTLRVEAVDGYNVNATASASVIVLADSTKPGVEINSPSDSNRSFRSNVNVPLAFLATSSAGNDITSTDVLLNGIAFDADGNPLTGASTSLGVFNEFAGHVTIHTVKVTATNGNGSTSDTRDFIIDDSKPVVDILRPTGASETDTTVQLSYNVSDSSNPNEATSWESVKLDGADIPQRSGHSIEGLLPGSTHVLTVQVKDLAGNLSNLATTSFTVEARDDDDDDHHDHHHHWRHKGKSNCFLEAIKGNDNLLREMLRCVSNYHSEHHR